MPRLLDESGALGRSRYDTFDRSGSGGFGEQGEKNYGQRQPQQLKNLNSRKRIALFQNGKQTIVSAKHKPYCRLDRLSSSPPKGSLARPLRWRRPPLRKSRQARSPRHRFILIKRFLGVCGIRLAAEKAIATSPLP